MIYSINAKYLLLLLRSEFFNLNIMDSGEIIFAKIEDIIGRTGMYTIFSKCGLRSHLKINLIPEFKSPLFFHKFAGLLVN